MSSFPEIPTSELMTTLLDAVRAANLVPQEQVNIDGVSDPVWEGTDEVGLFPLEQEPISDQNEILGYRYEIKVDVISGSLESAKTLLEQVCNVIESVPDNTYFRENQAVGKAVGGRKVNNGFIAARNYTIYAKGN